MRPLIVLVRRFATKPPSERTWSVQALLRGNGEESTGSHEDASATASQAQHAVIDDAVLDRLSAQACLPLDGVDREALKTDISRTLAFIEQVQLVDTTGVEPLVSLSEFSHDHLREDAPTKDSAVDVLANAPEKFQDFFVAPRESYFHGAGEDAEFSGAEDTKAHSVVKIEGLRVLRDALSTGWSPTLILTTHDETDAVGKLLLKHGINDAHKRATTTNTSKTTTNTTTTTTNTNTHTTHTTTNTNTPLRLYAAPRSMVESVMRQPRLTPVISVGPVPSPPPVPPPPSFPPGITLAVSVACQDPNNMGR
ncbi:hypothetical protein PTSG_03296 [Salpingoeca rosetta]|uniref:Glu-AdT subunit C n=1 Tax=Salpingoeca rosetta (strain ATCC 50818 / BSB-021) TaxID=946362 RepID=F2U4S3_SALR5|nr:uncharacterized protein PTSG_03296 [Salpingoeca rosetta]EGD82639.1 hypothetical protein PTSG_03296 [Salpingoeca rosetta]|eukprot:XP_004995875.1 hypothetical protein PTSG_03296 [Salpingoeca rosetta]